MKIKIIDTLMADRLQQHDPEDALRKREMFVFRILLTFVVLAIVGVSLSALWRGTF